MPAEPIESILDAVRSEIVYAIYKHAPMATCHEGYAVILEELDELWDEIKVKQINRNVDKLRKEALQVATMAVRFLHDLDGTK